MRNWVDEAIFYHIYPLGFCGAPIENNNLIQRENHIKKVISWINHLKEMQITAIYFGPLFESGSHGYDTSDYYQVDRRLGSNEDFKAVCEALHAEGIKVVLDGVFNHVGREFWAFKDLQEKRENSPYKDWFQNVDFNRTSPYGDPFWYEGWEGHFNLVKLNLRNTEVVKHILGAVNEWIKEFDIDGLRLDVAYCMDHEFFKQLKASVLTQKPDFWLMGEMIHGDYTTIANPELLDSATNYECYKGNYSSHNDKNYFEINYSLNRLFGQGGLYRGLKLYNFVDNHDVNRIASTLKNKEHLKNVYTMLFMMPGIPSVYYGSEWGVLGEKKNGSDQELRPSLEMDDFKNSDTSLIEHIGKLARIKQGYKALCYGLYEQVVVKNEQLIFKRTYEGEEVFVALNLADVVANMSFKVSGVDEIVDVLNDEVYSVEHENVNVEMPPYSTKILVKDPKNEENTK